MRRNIATTVDTTNPPDTDGSRRDRANPQTESTETNNGGGVGEATLAKIRAGQFLRPNEEATPLTDAADTSQKLSNYVVLECQSR
jgi:hypothetical protein